MIIEEVARLIWDGMQSGTDFQKSVRGELEMEDAYRVQMKILEFHLAAGEEHAGWKIGMTSEIARKTLNISSPTYGYLLKSRDFGTGTEFPFHEIIQPILEPEIQFVIGTRLQGPIESRGDVIDAVDSIAAAFEVASIRATGVVDIPLVVADNVSQWAYVTGELIKPDLEEVDLGEIVVEVSRNGSIVSKIRGADAIDNQLDSIVLLVNHLSDFGMALEAGQCVMTGSFTPHLPVEKGDQWESRVSGVGTVSTSFV